MPLAVLPYSRRSAVDYAHRWAYGRNPKYYDFENLGGDCTNFASQCLYAGTGVMNYTPTFGWYYVSANDKAPAWTGVEQLKNFLLRERASPGPFAAECAIGEAREGDIVQLRFASGRFGHTSVIVKTGAPATPENTLIAAHTYDADWRALSTYPFREIRFLHILGAYAQG